MEESTDQKENAYELMATPEFADELVALLKIRAPVIYLTCREEKRMLNYFKSFSETRGFKTFTWDICNGIKNLISGDVEKTASDDCTDPDNALSLMIEEANNDRDNRKKLQAQKVNGKIYLLLDFYRYLEEAATERRIKEFSKIDSMTTIILTGPYLDLPIGLENLFSVLDFPFPNREEIDGTTKNLLKIIGKEKVELEKTMRKQFSKEKHEIVGSVSGLTLVEAKKALAKSVVVHRAFNIPAILAEKKQVIRRSGSGALEFYEPGLTMADVGGLHRMVRWLERSKLSFHPDARDFGITALKGFLAVGCAGCGKSLVAKACSNLYKMPLLRLDFGALFRSLVGESEATTRDSIKLAEAMAPCALWLDEVEKGMSGTESSGSTDGGTTDRVVSTFLTWMQEKKSEVFVVATANDIEKIPVPFFRRFDEVFFVDFPNDEERVEIAQVLLRRYKRNYKDFDCREISDASKLCTGSEIEKAINIGLKEAFFEKLKGDKKRNLTTKDVVDAFATFTPQYRMKEEYFENMRSMAKTSGFVFANEESKLNQSGDDSTIGLDLSE